MAGVNGRCGFRPAGGCFVGGTPQNPMRSDNMDLITMIMFVSEKSKRHQEDFRNTDIIFELGDGQLW